MEGYKHVTLTESIINYGLPPRTKLRLCLFVSLEDWLCHLHLYADFSHLGRNFSFKTEWDQQLRKQNLWTLWACLWRELHLNECKFLNGEFIRNLKCMQWISVVSHVIIFTYAAQALIQLSSFQLILYY